MDREIIFVSNFMGNGGAARVITVLAEGFIEKGYKVYIYTFPFDAKEYPQSNKVEYVKIKPKSTHGLINKIERIKLLRKELKKHPNAKVISFEYFMNMQTIVAMVGLKNKLIISERNDPARMGGHFPINIFRNILYIFCDVLVCQTNDAKAYFPQYIQKKTVVIANPIKEDLPSPWLNGREPKIVNFCRLEKQKNLILLIDAFEMFYEAYPEYKLYIYGDGKEKENIQKYINDKRMQECVILHEAVNDVHDRVLKSKMYISTSDYEGMSNSMIEAMAIGLPTICTDCPCGGAKMVIKDGINGLLVPVGSKDMIFESMRKIADDCEFAELLSRNASKIRDELSVLSIIEKWNQYI